MVMQLIGLGSLIIMPLLGNLSDTHGRKVMLMLPLTLSIFPLGTYYYSFYLHSRLIIDFKIKIRKFNFQSYDILLLQKLVL